MYPLTKCIYIKFEAPNVAQLTQANRGLKRSLKLFFTKLLSTVLPKANPDFDHKIAGVRYWLVELDFATGIPQREIGLDKNAQVLLKMPFEDNYGYWTDNNLLLLKTEMNAGHGGKSGRDGAIEEIALDYAFALKISNQIS